MNNPLVSIIIPVYNGANYMREAIDSAIAQTYCNIEILVINDGSTDNGKTEEIALSYGDKIRYFYKENGGVSSALNLGIREMRGEYFSWLSHDDIYYPQKVFCQVEALKNLNAKDAICYCKSIHIDKNSKVISKKGKKEYCFKPSRLIDSEIVLSELFKKDTFNGCGLLIPKSIFFDNDLFFDENMRYSQDLFMWYQIFLNGYRLVFTEEIGVAGRIHEKQLTQNGKELYKKDSLAISEILLDEIIEKSNRKNKFIYYYLRHNAIYNNREVVIVGTKKAKEKKKISFFQKIYLKWVLLYGKIRPTIRRVYYRVVRRMKTN